MSSTAMTIKRNDQVKIKESLYPDEIGTVISVSYRSIIVQWSDGVGVYSFDKNTIEKIL